MHGDQDTTVPEHMGRAVFDAHEGPKTYRQFEGSGHSDVSAQLVVPPITAFINGVLAEEQQGALPELVETTNG
jgi:hypothetical protein